MRVDRQREVFLRNLFGGIRDAEGKVATARLRVRLPDEPTNSRKSERSKEWRTTGKVGLKKR